MLTKEEAAARLNGNEYGDVGSEFLWAEMKASGLVAIYRARNDPMEMRGAIEHEIGAYDDEPAFFTQTGLLRNECDEDGCPYHARERKAASAIHVTWDPWSFLVAYETTIPHAQFTIVKDGEPYCRGIVFALDDVPAPHPAPAASAAESRT